MVSKIIQKVILNQQAKILPGTMKRSSQRNNLIQETCKLYISFTTRALFHIYFHIKTQQKNFKIHQLV